MSIADIFNTKKPVVSFEIFPPKKNGVLVNADETIKSLKKLKNILIFD